VSKRALAHGRHAWDAARARSILTTEGMVESLYQLIEVEGHRQTDVALMFGVTRQRVHQWCRVIGLRSKQNGLGRRWNDATHRFEPARYDPKLGHRRRADYRAQYDAARQERWTRARAAVAQDPAITYPALCRALGIGRAVNPQSQLVHALYGAGDPALSRAGMAARLRQDLGLAPGRHGRPPRTIAKLSLDATTGAPYLPVSPNAENLCTLHSGRPLM
jgi:hypothetical protein